MAAGFGTVGLLRTRFNMEKDFYRARLSDRFGLEVLVPNEEGRATLHDIIYTELCNGIIREESREAYYRIITDLRPAGAQCLVWATPKLVCGLRG
jgi:aspartate racemase